MDIKPFPIFFFLFILLQGCFGTTIKQNAIKTPPQLLLKVFYTTGGDGPLNSYYYIYADGWLQQVTLGNKRNMVKVNMKELEQLKELLDLSKYDDVWNVLDMKKGKPLCCDLRYIEISFGVHRFFLTEGDAFSNEEIVLIKTIDNFLQVTCGKKYNKWSRLTDILE